MKIAINAFPYRTREAVRRLKSLLLTVDRRHRNHSWFVYGPPATIREIEFPATAVAFREVAVRRSHLDRLFTEQLRLPVLLRGDAVDVIFTAGNADLFFASRPRVLGIGETELSRTEQDGAGLFDRLCSFLWNWIARRSMNSVDRIVCPADLATRLTLALDAVLQTKLATIPRGVGKPFSPDSPPPATAPERYLLASAATGAASEFETLIHACKTSREKGISLPLVVIGFSDATRRRRAEQIVQRAGLSGGIMFAETSEPETVAGLMANAELFILGSAAPGDPATLVEAMRCGAAIIAADCSPNREVAGASVSWYDGQSHWELSNLIERVLGDATYRNILRKKARVRAAHYSWETTAEVFVRILEQVYDDCLVEQARPTTDEIAARIRHP